MVEETIETVEVMREPTDAELDLLVNARIGSNVLETFEGLDIELNIDEVIYVNDHFEIMYSIGAVKFQTQYKASKNTSQDIILEQVKKAYILANSGINFNNITEIPTPVEPTPPTAEEISKLEKEELVMRLKAEKDELSKDLEVGYDKARQLNEVEGTMSEENFNNAKANLTFYLDTLMPLFLVKYEEYLIEKTILERL